MSGISTHRSTLHDGTGFEAEPRADPKTGTLRTEKSARDEKPPPKRPDEDNEKEEER